MIDSQDAQETRRAMKQAWTAQFRTSHLLTPLRTLQSVAPSGGTIEFHKYSDSDNELSYWFGILTAVEHNTAWKASRMAAHGDESYWDAALAFLRQAGWTVEAS